MTVKAAAKHLIYRCGGLSAFRRLQPNTLTILLLHRVLPVDDPRARTADLGYTLRLDTFEACLDAVRHWYHPISLSDIENAFRHQSKLPKNALLVTFDDGWADTAQYAVPALQSRGIPGVVFIATGAIGNEHTPWRDIAACLWRAGLGNSETENPGSLEALWQWLDRLPEQERNEWLSAAVNRVGRAVRPLMMSLEALRQLAREGVGLGGHGVSHTPLTKLADPASESRRCAVQFQDLTGQRPTSFAFPHGLYTQRELQAVQHNGFDFVFTSDRHLNPIRDGRPLSSVFGRISISQDDVTDSDGRFIPEKLAYWLTFQPVRNPP